VDPNYVYLLDKNFTRMVLLEDYISLVWARRYSDTGDFVLELPMHYVDNDHVRIDNHLMMSGVSGFMIIEDINPIVDEQGDSKLRLTGSSGSKLLHWRVLEDPFFADALPQQVISLMMNNHILTPTNSARTIEYFTGLTILAATTVNLTETYEPDTIYNIIRSICEAYDWGFEVTLSLTPDPNLTLIIYQGKDRSLSQSTNNPVIFSQDFGNLLSEDYHIQTSHERNMTLVLTSDPVLSHIYVYQGNEPSGRRRKEIILLAEDLDTTTSDLTEEELQAIAEHRAEELLRDRKAIGVFDGAVDTVGPFAFGQDYDLGDIVQFVILGNYVRGRAVEFIRTVNQQGVIDHISFDFDLDDIKLLWRD
jgi:hypothetical protein